MSRGRSGIPRQLRTLFGPGTAAALSDAELLGRFATRRDAAAEAAFAALVERHGPTVLRVCREVLRDPDDAEDAFQATFLVLARRAGSIRKRESVASWLYGVALRVAARARSSANRRHARERRAAASATATATATRDVGDPGPGDDLGSALVEEVGRLPEAHRAAVLLCYWEGLTHEQAAARLGWPVGTVRSRMAWARRRLRARLSRRGLAPTAAFPPAPRLPSPPSALIEGTIQTALQFAIAAGRAPGTVPASAWALAEGVSRTMLLAKIGKLTAMVALLAIGMVAAGARGLARQERAPDAPPEPAAARDDPPAAPAPRRGSDADARLRELKARKASLEASLEKLVAAATATKPSDGEHFVWVHHDLERLRPMQESLMKRIEQLRFDARRR